MSAPALHGGETADELLFLGAAYAHIAAYREHQRLERIERRNRIAAQLATGIRVHARIVHWP